jgi:4-carboxymuconolactone decarboxylase
MTDNKSSAGAPRFEEPDPAKMDAETRRVYDMVLGKRGRLPGPFRIWLANPEFSEIAEEFGRRVRFGSGLSRRVVELATIIACRNARAQYAWHSHRNAAREVGIPEDVIVAIRDGKTPDIEDETEAAVYAFCHEVLENKSVSDATFHRIDSRIGRPALIDLMGLIGFYGVVAITLNAFNIPPAGGAELELKD